MPIRIRARSRFGITYQGTFAVAPLIRISSGQSTKEPSRRVSDDFQSEPERFRIPRRFRMAVHTSANPVGIVPATGAFDLRAWIEKARTIGQLREVENADPRLELGAITELNAKRRGPALLFKGFAGYLPGFRVLTGSMLNARTLGLTMGIEENLETMALTDRIADKLRLIEPKTAEYPVEFVAAGPGMENQAASADHELTIFSRSLCSVFVG